MRREETMTLGGERCAYCFRESFLAQFVSEREREDDALDELHRQNVKRPIGRIPSIWFH